MCFLGKKLSKVSPILGQEWEKLGKSFQKFWGFVIGVFQGKIRQDVSLMGVILGEVLKGFGPTKKVGFYPGLADENQTAGHTPVIHLKLTEIGSGSDLSAEGIGAVPLNRILPHALKGRVKGHQFLPVDAVDFDRNTGLTAGPGYIRLKVDLRRFSSTVFPDEGFLHCSGYGKADTDGVVEGVGPADQKIRRKAW